MYRAKCNDPKCHDVQLERRSYSVAASDASWHNTMTGHDTEVADLDEPRKDTP